MPDFEATYYDSVALLEDAWEAEKAARLADGWEYLPVRAGVVYLRKLIRGERNLESKGWLRA